MILSVAGAVVQADPFTYWVPLAGAVIVQVVGIIAARAAVKKAGANSDKALARTIEADREARILERQFDLYADLLTHVFERKAGRDVVVTAIKLNGWEPYNPYKPEEIYRLTGRARAIAETSVLEAFNASNDASGAVIRAWDLLQMLQDDPEWAKRWKFILNKKNLADAADLTLEAAIRAALDQAPLSTASVPPEKEDRDTEGKVDEP